MAYLMLAARQRQLSLTAMLFPLLVGIGKASRNRSYVRVTKKKDIALFLNVPNSPANTSCALPPSTSFGIKKL